MRCAPVLRNAAERKILDEIGRFSLATLAAERCEVPSLCGDGGFEITARARDIAFA